MRILLSLLAIFALTATTLADDWTSLLNAGKETAALAAARKQAETGDARAIAGVAYFYLNGRGGVKADPEQAAVLYRTAAELGDAGAQWQYGVLLDTAEGVDLDSAAAVGWFEKSATQNFPSALVSLGVMYSSGRGVPRDAAKALDYYRRGAMLHNVHAFNELGIVYIVGEGVPADKIEAMAYLLVGARYGDTGAKSRVREFRKQLDAGELKKAGRRAQELIGEYGMPTGKITATT